MRKRIHYFAVGKFWQSKLAVKLEYLPLGKKGMWLVSGGDIFFGKHNKKATYLGSS